MKTIRYIFGLLALVGMLSSCDDYLDTKEDSPYSDEFAYTLPGSVEGMLTNAYIAIPGQVDHYGGDFLDAATGDAVTNQYGSTIYALGAGKMSSASNPIATWSTAYDNFQWIHLFMEKVADTTAVKFWLSSGIKDSTERHRLIGEAHFLRAYWGMELLRVHGGEVAGGEVLGYPIVTEFLTDVNGEHTMTLPRNTYEECVLQILADCDVAIAMLPLEYPVSAFDLADPSQEIILDDSHIGRASGAAALVLKSRVATYAASPAFTGVSEDATAKWQRAAYLSQHAIDTLGLSYRTYGQSMAEIASGVTPSDYLLRKYHNNNSLESRNLPPAFRGGGRTCPSQNLVDAFPMKDGLPITDPNSGYDAQDPYADRDPRLANTVLYNGAPVETGGRGLEVAETIVQVIMHIDTVGESTDDFGNVVYEFDTLTKTITREGYDSQIADYRASRTGYYLRKWISNKADMLTNINEKLNSEHQHPIIRANEAFYNLAEASLHATQDPHGIAPNCSESAYSILKSTRSLSINLFVDPYVESLSTVDEFQALLMQERRLEFAFENHRYFDLRRWEMPLTETVRGMKVSQDVDGVYSYEGTDPAADNSAFAIEERIFTQAYIYHPLPLGEMLKNPNLVNNIGW